jgi:hypothetical protein
MEVHVPDLRVRERALHCIARCSFTSCVGKTNINVSTAASVRVLRTDI